MSHSIEKICTSHEFQIWAASASEFPGYVTKGWALQEFRAGYPATGRGWVTFDTPNHAMLFKLASSC